MRAVPPNQWVELTDLVRFDEPVRVENGHPSLRSAAPCRFETIDYDPFDDVLEIQISFEGGTIRLLIDDPREIRFEPGEGLEVDSLDQTVEIHPAPPTVDHRARPRAGDVAKPKVAGRGAEPGQPSSMASTMPTTTARIGATLRSTI